MNPQGAMLEPKQIKAQTKQCAYSVGYTVHVIYVGRTRVMSVLVLSP